MDTKQKICMEVSEQGKAEQYRDLNFDISVGEVPSVKTLKSAITYAKRVKDSKYPEEGKCKSI